MPSGPSCALQHDCKVERSSPVKEEWKGSVEDKTEMGVSSMAVLMETNWEDRREPLMTCLNMQQVRNGSEMSVTRVG